MLGWETGRDSEPGLLNMNLHSLREQSLPSVCLYQYDRTDPMNPLGLLLAYAEKQVLPVVSDMDTLLVGSKGGMKYEQLSHDQTELVKWCLEKTESLLAS